MTPNQLRFRASGFKGFRHIPLGPCSGFKAKLYDFIFLFFFFFFFFSFLEDNFGLQLLVTQTYPRLSTCLRPVLQSGKRHTNLQPIEAIWSAVCELAQRGNFQVEHAGTVTEQKFVSSMGFVLAYR